MIEHPFWKKGKSAIHQRFNAVVRAVARRVRVVLEWSLAKRNVNHVIRLNSACARDKFRGSSGQVLLKS